MDDESYFTFDNSGGHQNNFYYEYKGLEVPKHVKYRFTDETAKSTQELVEKIEKNCN